MSGEDTFARIVREYGPALRRLAGAWESDPAAQDDLLQDIVIALWRALPRFRGRASERTYVYRVAMNRVLTHRYRRPPRGEPLDAASDVRDPRRTPEADAAAAQQRRHLLAALRSLPPATRQILALALEGLSRAEIAEVLGITENNATVRLSRARRALQEALTQP